MSLLEALYLIQTVNISIYKLIVTHMIKRVFTLGRKKKLANFRERTS